MPTRWRMISLLLIAALSAVLVASALPVAADVEPVPRGQACPDVVNNGGFEFDFAWEFDPSPALPQYVASVPLTDARALQLGGAAVPATSTARQRIAIPAGMTSAILDFWYYPLVEASPGADYFRFSVWSADGSVMRWESGDLPLGYEMWQPAAFDFGAWGGQTFQIAFTVFNDGEGGVTTVFLDDVSLPACFEPGTTPTPWPTPWPTPMPTAPVWTPPPANDCFNALQNGNFDAGLAGWTPGRNPLQPSVVGSPFLTLPPAVELGSTVQNINSYSSIRQTVTIPPGYARTFIGFWENTWAESLSGGDLQQFVLLGPGSVVWATPWKTLENSESWRQHLYELIGAPSPTFDVYFAAVNDGVGGRTALYVDDVYVWACPAGAMPPAGPVPAMPFSDGAMPPAGQVPAMPFSDAAAPLDVIPLTPGPAQLIAPPAVMDDAAFPLATMPTPVFVPFDSEPILDSRSLDQVTAVASGAPLDVTGFPTPEWTEVALPGQPSPTTPAGAQPPTTGTPTSTGMPPQGRAIGTQEAGAPAAPTPTVTPTAAAPNWLQNVVEDVKARVAQWPVSWRRVLTALGVLAGLVVVLWVASAVFGRRQRPPRDYWS